MKKIIILAFFIFSCSLYAVQNDANKEEIVRVLEQWPKDFNSKNIEAVCGLFAEDLVASYPATPDRNYDQMCAKLTAAINDSQKSYHYEAPEIEQIILAEDLAAVRLIWTLKTGSQITREKGLDLFRLQKDGSWKIVVSYAYPL
jgi:ketosteroid isomerase-like protein